MEQIKVVQWATGGVGRAAIEGVLSHPDLVLAGAWVHSPDKQGRDVGEVLGLGEVGVTTTGSLEESAPSTPTSSSTRRWCRTTTRWSHC